MVEVDLKADVDFFDRLVELIPAKHYLADPDDRVDLRHMKKRDREEFREQFKKQHKEAKKASLDPSTAKGTLELQKLKSAAEEVAKVAAAAEAAAASEADGRQQPNGQPAVIDGADAKGPFDREALRAKLQARLEEMRKLRKADEQGKKVQSAKQWRDSTLDEGRKKAAEKRKHEALKPAPQQRSGGQEQPPAHKHDGGRPAKQRRTEDAARLTFSKVDFGRDGDKKKGKHKPTKEELLQEAERRKAAIESGAVDEGKISQEAWGAAFKRAQGEKVLDDPKLLRRSLKKESKMKQKKAKVWTERTAKQKEDQAAKQDKRRTNLQRRVDAKKEAKKAKREKKLLRAGFEGRKQGFIATPGKKS